MKKKSLYLAVMLFFISVSLVSGQDNTLSQDTPSEKLENVSQQQQSAAGAPEVPAPVKNEPAGNNVQNKKTEPVSNTLQKDSFSSGLLLITEGNFKYGRIPGIVLSQPKPLAVDNIANTSSKKSSTVDSAEEGEESPAGLFGMSKKTADTAIKIFILLLILGILILYKSRSNKGRRKVFSVHSRK